MNGLLDTSFLKFLMPVFDLRREPFHSIFGSHEEVADVSHPSSFTSAADFQS